MTNEPMERPRPLRFLIAEDEVVLAFALRMQLEQRGLEVVGVAMDGQTALDQCRRLRPDVVLMDVKMPTMDGLESTRLIMEQCPTCVIIVTAFAEEDCRRQAKAAGAMCFLPKPVQAAGVLKELAAAQARFAEFDALLARSPSAKEALEAWRQQED